MITFLRGKLVEGLPDRLVMDVNGVGYEVQIPLSTYDRFASEGGKEVTVLTHFHVRENEQALYGFATADERDLFRLLIDRVSGIGPKLGIAVLSGLSVAAFKAHVVDGDVTQLSKVKGLGKKTAERIVLELRDKVGVAEAWQVAGAAGGSPQSSAANDAVLALIALGYKQGDAQKAVKNAMDGLPSDGGSTDDVVRAALREISR